MGSNYERSIHKHLTEQIEKTEQLQTANKLLRAENAALKLENKKLQSKIIELETTMTDKIAIYVAEAVKLATEPLVEELNKSHTEISRLKAIINKDPTNSSNPPSTSRFKSIPNSREKSGKSQGGQKGHKGHRLKLPENIDELEDQGIIEKRLVDHTDGSAKNVSKFVVDLEMKVVITEHRFLEDEVPEAFFNEVSYGNNVKTQAVLLMNEGIVAHKRLSGIISGITHGIVNLSTGTLSKFQSNFANRLTESGELEAIKNDLLNGEVMCTDDTSSRVLERIVYPDDKEPDGEIIYERAEKKSFRATVRTHSNENSTYYTVNPQKDMKGIERDNILPQYTGSLCHDHESKFYNYGKDNGSCGAHLSRDLKGLSDSYNCPWALEMRKFVLGMNEHKNKDVAQGVAACDPITLTSFENEYDRLLAQGREALSQMDDKEWGRSEFNAMLNRLTNFKNSYMLFIRNYKVPFTNNLAERDLRSEKTKEKVSGMFRSWKGIEDHSKVNSFVSTIKKRGKDLFCSIKQVFEGEPVLS